jgi:hypothetical protein
LYFGQLVVEHFVKLIRFAPKPPNRCRSAERQLALQEADIKQQSSDSRQLIADSKQTTDDSREQTADSR